MNSTSSDVSFKFNKVPSCHNLIPPTVIQIQSVAKNPLTQMRDTKRLARTRQSCKKSNVW